MVRHRPEPASNTNACAGHAMHGPCRLVPRSVERKSSISDSTRLIPACGQDSCMANTSVSAPGSLRYHTHTFSACHSGWVSTHKSMHTYSVPLRELGSVATRIGPAACASSCIVCGHAFFWQDAWRQFSGQWPPCAHPPQNCLTCLTPHLRADLSFDNTLFHAHA